MGHTFTTVRVHVVFSTQGRRPLLLAEVQPRVWDYIGGIGKKHGIPIHEVGGIENHVHILLSIPATVTISEGVLVEMVERNGRDEEWTLRVAGGIRGFQCE